MKLRRLYCCAVVKGNYFSSDAAAHRRRHRPVESIGSGGGKGAGLGFGASQVVDHRHLFGMFQGTESRTSIHPPLIHQPRPLRDKHNKREGGGKKRTTRGQAKTQPSRSLGQWWHGKPLVPHKPQVVVGSVSDSPTPTSHTAPCRFHRRTHVLVRLPSACSVSEVMVFGLTSCSPPAFSSRTFPRGNTKVKHVLTLVRHD